jgi:hypothetical protein
MRLSEIDALLREAIPHLIDIKVEYVARNDVNFPVLSGVNSFKRGVAMIKKTGLFQKEVAVLEDSLIYRTTSDSIEVSGKEAEIITSGGQILRTTAYHLHNALISVINNEEKETVYIKLPESKDFKSLAAACTAFDTILSQIILDPDIDGSIEIEQIEPGSIWLKVNLKKTSAVALIAAMAWSGAVIYKKLQEARYMAELVRTQTILNDHKEKVSEVFFETYKKAVLEQEAQHILDEHFKTEDPERFKRLKVCLDLLSKEMEKGAEIQPALTAPEDVKNLFPDIKKLPTIESKVKLLTNEK